MVAIEANPKTFKLLETNIALNNSTNIQAFNVAASDKAETLKFVANRVNSGGSKRMPKIRDTMYFYDAPEVMEVNAVSLDKLLGAQRFNLVIMDIEGSEYFALKGMTNIIRSSEALFMEFLPHHLANVAGVSVTELVEQISSYFEYLYIPSKSLQVRRDRFLDTLKAMYEAGEGDEGLVFSKRDINSNVRRAA